MLFFLVRRREKHQPNEDVVLLSRGFFSQTNHKKTFFKLILREGDRIEVKYNFYSFFFHFWRWIQYVYIILQYPFVSNSDMVFQKTMSYISHTKYLQSIILDFKKGEGKKNFDGMRNGQRGWTANFKNRTEGTGYMWGHFFLNSIYKWEEQNDNAKGIQTQTEKRELTDNSIRKQNKFVMVWIASTRNEEEKKKQVFWRWRTISSWWSFF